jgi:hypothetical protein
MCHCVLMSEKRAAMSIYISAGLPGAMVLTLLVVVPVSSRSSYCHVPGIYSKYCQYSHS